MKKTREGQRFTKEQLLKSKALGGRRDLAAALLDEGEAYTLAEAQERLEAFMKGKVR